MKNLTKAIGTLLNRENLKPKAASKREQDKATEFGLHKKTQRFISRFSSLYETVEKEYVGGYGPMEYSGHQICSMEAETALSHLMIKMEPFLPYWKKGFTNTLRRLSSAEVANRLGEINAVFGEYANKVDNADDNEMIEFGDAEEGWGEHQKEILKCFRDEFQDLIGKF